MYNFFHVCSASQKPVNAHAPGALFAGNLWA